MYGSIECNEKYSKTSRSLRSYYGKSGVGEDRANYYIRDSKSCDYKTSITGKLENNYAI